MVPVVANEYNFSAGMQQEISDAIDEAVSELRIGKHVDEYPVKVTVDLVDNALSIHEKTASIRAWLKEKNISYETNFLLDEYPSLTRDYFFTNEQDALLFILSMGD